MPKRLGRDSRARTRVARSTSTRVMRIAENIDAATPTTSVKPNPLTAPEAKKNRMRAASTVVALESAIALQALSKPLDIAVRSLRPSANSSLPRSKIRTCLLYTSDAADDLLCVDLG